MKFTNLPKITLLLTITLLLILSSHSQDPKDSKLETLSIDGKDITVRYESSMIAKSLNSMPINCFQFSTATPKKDYPGKSKLSDVNEANIRRNFKEDNAILIQFKDGKITLEKDAAIQAETKYYMIGVMWYPGEFHVVRSFKDGWFSKPSKVGQGYWVTDKFRGPSEGLSNILAKQSGPRKYNFLGFYLYPINEDNVSALIGGKSVSGLNFLE